MLYLQLITYICIKTYIYDLRRTLHNDQKKEKNVSIGHG